MIRNRSSHSDRRRNSLLGRVGSSTRMMLDFGMGDGSHELGELVEDRPATLSSLERNCSGGGSKQNRVSSWQNSWQNSWQTFVSKGDQKEKMPAVQREVVFRAGSSSDAAVPSFNNSRKLESQRNLGETEKQAVRRPIPRRTSDAGMKAMFVGKRQGRQEPSKRGTLRYHSMPLAAAKETPESTVDRKKKTHQATRGKEPQGGDDEKLARSWGSEGVFASCQPNACRPPKHTAVERFEDAETIHGGEESNSRDESFSRDFVDLADQFIVLGNNTDSVSSLDIPVTPPQTPRRGVSRIATTALSCVVNETNRAQSGNGALSEHSPTRPRGLTRSRTLPVAAVIQRKDTWKRPLIQLAPGVSLPLRGSEETIDALKRNELVHVECTACETFLHCIQTAKFVLCTVCRSISSVEHASTGSANESSIGLGITVEDIMESNASA